MLGRIALTNKLVSKKLDLDERLVGSVVDFCMKELDKEFYELNHHYLFVKGLGTFGINLTAINKRLRYILPKYRGFKNKVARGPVKQGYFNQYKGFQNEILYLFKVRRKLIFAKRVNNKLRQDARAARKIENDFKR